MLRRCKSWARSPTASSNVVNFLPSLKTTPQGFRCAGFAGHTFVIVNASPDAAAIGDGAAACGADGVCGCVLVVGFLAFAAAGVSSGSSPVGSRNVFKRKYFSAPVMALYTPLSSLSVPAPSHKHERHS